MKNEFFMIFEAQNVARLNDQIYEFTEKNGLEEIYRSAPGYALFEGYPRVAVTSTFREKRKDDTKPNSFNNDDSKSFK